MNENKMYALYEEAQSDIKTENIKVAPPTVTLYQRLYRKN